LQLVAGACLLVFVATATLAGGRLLWLGWGTGHRPELLLGYGAILVVTVALPLSIGSGFGGPAGEVLVPLWIVSELVTQIGIVCFYAFTQQVFRPRSPWARAPVVLAAALLPFFLARAGLGLAAAAPETSSVAATGAWLVLCHVVYGAAFLWSALEGLRQHVLARRRLALGLADPAVVNRFLLFALFGLACTGIAAANAAAVLLERNLATSLVVLAPSAVLGLVAAGAIYVAVLPPRAYLRRVRRNAGTLPRSRH
jgi:hypothetical protein